MPYSNPLSDRERALEDAFFKKETERLIDAMRKKESQETQRMALAEALGISSTEIVEPLVKLGLRESNVSALIMAPLVAVGWADGLLDNDERRLIVRSEIALGVEPESEGARLVELWLEHRPHASLIDAWASYIRELCQVLAPDRCRHLRDDILSRSNRIASAIEKSFMRGGGATPAEKAVLEKIEAAFAAVADD